MWDNGQLNVNMLASVFSLHKGATPLLLSLPHVGTTIPEELKSHYSERALAVEDTDWHLDRLYDFAKAMGASIIVPRISRYVIDLNRPPDDVPMYPGASNTELCPTRFFSGDSLYVEGAVPNVSEVNRRRAAYWQPYHDALRAELERVRTQFGYALLWDGHSIRSEIPWLFDGKLPDLNLGTASGMSCADSLRGALVRELQRNPKFTHAADGRFKGGYITRNYGRPAQSIHAVQMEMCQSLYMQESLPFELLDDKAAQVRPLLRQLLEVMLGWKPR
jgi:N-formylglutamate deformylase